MKEDSTWKLMWGCWLVCAMHFILQPKSSQTLPLNRAWWFWGMLTFVSETALRGSDQGWCKHRQMFTRNYMALIPKEWGGGHPAALRKRDGLPGHGLLVRAQHNMRMPVGTCTSAVCILPWFICAVPVTHPLLWDVDAFRWCTKLINYLSCVFLTQFRSRKGKVIPPWWHIAVWPLYTHYKFKTTK